MNDLRWFSGRRVFVTGHTGFKGAWLCLWLQRLGADVTGYSLAPDPNGLFDVSSISDGMRSLEHDVRDRVSLERALLACDPEVVFHLAAQALVRKSYADPFESFSTNVMGTVNILDISRRCPNLKAIVNVTSDKCYENNGSGRPFDETDPMGGHDPYSASKGAAEIAATGMVRSFYAGSNGNGETQAHVASARAGNVIGGGDWADDRIVPDLMRAAFSGDAAFIRNPNATRPWQHVLEPLHGYLMLAHRLGTQGRDFVGGWNFGPDDDQTVTVGTIVQAISKLWPAVASEFAQISDGPHEANFLALDCTKAKRQLGWEPMLSLGETLDMTTSWYRTLNDCPKAAPDLAGKQIDDYETKLATRHKVTAK